MERLARDGAARAFTYRGNQKAADELVSKLRASVACARDRGRPRRRCRRARRDTDMNPASGPLAEHLTRLTAVKRYTRAAEIASFVAHLAGPDGAYITGTGRRIDGGFAA